MRTETECGGGSPVLDEPATAVYRHATGRGVIDSMDAVARDLGTDTAEVCEAVERLVDNRLLRAEQNGADQQFVPVDPKIAAALLVSPMEQEIYQRKELIAQVNEWSEALSDDFDQAAGRDLPWSAAQPVIGELEVRGYLRTVADSCRDEVLVMHSGSEDADTLDDFASVCLDLLERGITVQILCRHRNRADMVARTTMKRLLEAGAIVRTACRVPREAVVFDRSQAVLLGTGSDEDPTAARVAEQELVEFLLDMFEHLWDLALPLTRVDCGYSDVTGDLHRTIASLMAKGITDEVVARRLGISVRTCRRHIAELMSTLGAVSRFQAGLYAANQGLLCTA
ncbi:helix-turn-helix transcriptional regulator [Pseudonocardia endophytica]|uniref:Regulatory LuxR family protein n=1 Tax=Pseudonocardia endophytica TaxID=401976 RepID=A0A4R1HMM7_PSEEN|nr:helix-turn-helix transcriptional regulator [Pseudonocardia endophytica]TCK22303.1 regulatory LuxR family protein [Pseudonocardia endophytica]